MNFSHNNPMSEYLLKLQLIITNSEFKNKKRAQLYETIESTINGNKYADAKLNKDIFESYEYQNYHIDLVLQKLNYDQNFINLCLTNHDIIPLNAKNMLKEEQRRLYILNYVEPNKYYLNLSGKPYEGTEFEKDPIINIPDEFFSIYADKGVMLRNQPIHELSPEYQEIFINSKYYEEILKKYPDVDYLRYLGSRSIPIEVSRKAKDGEILKMNVNKMTTYHKTLGHVTVEPDIINAYINIYNKTRDYVYFHLKGEFSDIYPNYDSFMHFLTIYLSIGNALNEFMKKSSKLIYMNNITANNLFSLYGLPSVIMEGQPMIEFLKKFRLLLMDKGTNIVYRVKDLIGYQNTDIYTLIMVKQQVFKNGIPLYTYTEDGERVPVSEIVFRRFGTTGDNTSYFNFRENKKEYSLHEITSGDPRWWLNTPEDQQILYDMNYTLSNSKYIQLSTNVSLSDVWWDTIILLRGLLDNKKITDEIILNTTFNIDNKSTISLFDAVVTIILIMTWHTSDAFGKTSYGDLNINNSSVNGVAVCIDKLFNGLDENGKPLPFKDGRPFKVSSFNYDILELDPDVNPFYLWLKEQEYLEYDKLSTMLIDISNHNNANIISELTDDVKKVYRYLEKKLYESRTIHEFRQVVDAYKELFLVDPEREWFSSVESTVEDILMSTYDLSLFDYNVLKTVFYDSKVNNTPDFVISYNCKNYPIYLYDIMNNNVMTIEINDEYPFKDKLFVNEFITYIKTYRSISIQSTTISDSIRNNYQDIIIDKVNLDIGNTSSGPKSFEILMYRENQSLYRYLLELRNSDPNQLILTLRTLIQSLENYLGDELFGLKFEALGHEEYFRILKEVITYFKSYMVEFTKEEFSYIFDGLFDNGGNSNMLRLYDEIHSYDLNIIPKESLTLYDVSYITDHYVLKDHNEGVMYDDVIIRIEGTYAKIKEYSNTLGIEIWYDDGSRITKMKPNSLSDTDKIIVNIVESPQGRKIIINVNNINRSGSYGVYKKN